MDNYENPKKGKTYISPSLSAFGGSDRKVRIASKVMGSPDTYAFATVKDELVLRHKEGAKTHIKATFFEDDRRISVLNIQGYTVASAKPHNASFSFVGEEIGKLLEFIDNVRSVTFKSKGSINVTDEDLRRLVVSNSQARSLVQDNEDIFAEVVRSSITKQDVVAVGYRKRQLEVFRQLIEDSSYFESIKARKECSDVVGSLAAFVGEHGVNQEQYRSFELFRRNTVTPEILTFDELYERAKFIVHASES